MSLEHSSIEARGLASEVCADSLQDVRASERIQTSVSSQEVVSVDDTALETLKDVRLCYGAKDLENTACFAAIRCDLLDRRQAPRGGRK